MSSHADTHDLDKLDRWHRNLSSGDSAEFPAYAVFLVSDTDLAAHGVFRRFRSSFESHGAGFEHLVIFGQHGVSSTVRGLMAEFGLSPEDVPSLVLISRPSATTVYTIPLSRVSEGEERSCLELLAAIEDAADRGEEVLNLTSLPGLMCHQLGNGSLIELVGRVLEGLGDPLER